MLIPDYVLNVCHSKIITRDARGLPVVVDDPNNPGHLTEEYTWERGTKVSIPFTDFGRMGGNTFYISVNSITVADFPYLKSKKAAASTSFLVKSNWTGDVVLQTFFMDNPANYQQMESVIFPDNSCIHKVTKPHRNLELEIIPVFPPRVDGLLPYPDSPKENENATYEFPAEFVDFSQIRLGVVVHAYVA